MGDFLALLRQSERLGLAVAVAAAIAGLLMIVTEFSTITWVDVANESCKVIKDADPEQADRCVLSGFERHGGAVAVLGLLAVFMGWGAGFGRSRPAAGALAAIGVIVLGIGLLSDLPETGRTGLIGVTHGEAKARKGTGFYLELAGGALAIWAATLRLAARTRETGVPRTDST
jgi:hypothetical protein